MLLVGKSKKIFILRHLIVGILAFIIIYLFWLSRPLYSQDVRIWRALGDSAFSFLCLALIIGPLARLWPPGFKLILWRRELGIWTAILASLHFLRVAPFALSEPGIELPRLLGFIALFWLIVLASTSSDRAISFLSSTSWKWLHSMVYVIFYLTASHAAYFLFWRYPEDNWFKIPFIIMAVTVPSLQMAAFIKEIIRRRKTLQKPLSN